MAFLQMFPERVQIAAILQPAQQQEIHHRALCTVQRSGETRDQRRMLIGNEACQMFFIDKHGAAACKMHGPSGKPPAHHDCQAFERDRRFFLR